MAANAANVGTAHSREQRLVVFKPVAGQACLGIPRSLEAQELRELRIAAEQLLPVRVTVISQKIAAAKVDGAIDQATESRPCPI
jgi:hypothetical protein